MERGGCALGGNGMDMQNTGPKGTRAGNCHLYFMHLQQDFYKYGYVWGIFGFRKKTYVKLAKFKGPN